MKKIHEKLFIMRDYLKTTLEDMTQFKDHCKKLPTYAPFIAEMDNYSMVLQHMYDEFSIITPNKVSFKKFTQIGHIMKCFYQLYKNKRNILTLISLRKSLNSLIVVYKYYFNNYLLQNKYKIRVTIHID